MTIKETIDKGFDALEWLRNTYGLDDDDCLSAGRVQELAELLTSDILKSYTISILQAQVDQLEGRRILYETPVTKEQKRERKFDAGFNSAITDQQTALQAIIDEMV